MNEKKIRNKINELGSKRKTNHDKQRPMRMMTITLGLVSGISLIHILMIGIGGVF